MKYTVKKSVVQIVGRIWMPACVCAQEKILCAYDVENARDDDGQITRESVEQWLTSNSGDFSHVMDFCASIEDGDKSVEIPWADPESQYTFTDAMFPCED